MATYPAPLQAYFATLGYHERLEYAQVYAAHVLEGTPAPLRPSGAWVIEAEEKVRFHCTPPPSPPPPPVNSSGKQRTYDRLHALAHLEPELLGPGSKEHKAVFANLAEEFAVPPGSKQALCAALVKKAGGSWDASCFSTGDTVSGEGLIRVEAAVKHLRSQRPLPVLLTPVEVDALLSMAQSLTSSLQDPPYDSPLYTAQAALTAALAPLSTEAPHGS